MVNAGADPEVFLRGFDLIKLPYFLYMYSEGKAWANSVDSDQMSQNAASDQDLHSL